MVSRVGGFIRIEGYIDKDTGAALIGSVEEALKEGKEQIILLIRSAGGLSGEAFKAIDRISELRKRYGAVDRPIPLWTLGCEDVSSAAILLFSSGDKRILAKQVRMRFHESVLLFGTAVDKGTTQQEIREAIAEIVWMGRVYKGQKVVALLRKFSASKFAEEGGFVEQMQTCALLASKIEVGDEQSYEWTADIVEFLETHLRAVGEYDRDFADMVGRRSGLTAGVIRGFMLEELEFSAEQAVKIGLADKVI